jgi:hypothetical protein
MFCNACGSELVGAFCGRCGAAAVGGQARPLGEDPVMRIILPVGRSGWAIAAGYLGLFGLVVIPAPLALLVGLVAIRDLRRHPEKRGAGRAWFGVVVGLLGTCVLGAIVLRRVLASGP